MFNPLPFKSAKDQNPRKILNFILQNDEKQMVPCKSTAEEVSFEWSDTTGFCQETQKLELHYMSP